MNLPTGPDKLCFDKDEFMKVRGPEGGRPGIPGGTGALVRPNAEALRLPGPGSRGPVW